MIAVALFLGSQLSLPTWQVVLGGSEPIYIRSWWWSAPLSLRGSVPVEQSICWGRSLLPAAAAILILLLVRHVSTRSVR